MIAHVRKGVIVHAHDTGDNGRLALCGRLVADGQTVRKAFPVTCKGCQEVLVGPRFSFCESVMASGTSGIHIRILTGRGMRPSGGADTPSLCGREMAWDVPGVVNEATAADPRTCRQCLPVWREAVRLLAQLTEV